MSWVSSSPGAADEGLALEVFLLARTFAHEQQVGVGAADPEHHLRAARPRACTARNRTPPPRRMRVVARRLRRVRGCDRTSRVTRHSPDAMADRSDDGADAIRAAPRIGLRHDLGRHRAERSRLRLDQRRSRARSRGRRRSGCAPAAAPGPNPSCALRATRWQPTLSSTASVTTTTSVVLARSSSKGWSAEMPARRWARWIPRPRRPSPATTSPTAFTTASATTARIVGAARPRCRDPPRPRARGRATSRPSRPRPRRPDPAARGGGRLRPRPRTPRPRRAGCIARPESNTHAVGTIGTGPPAVGKTDARSARNRITPSAAARPNAEPPANTTASTRLTVRAGFSNAELAARGRTAAYLAEPTVPSGTSTP